MTANAMTKTHKKPGTHESPKQESPGKDREKRLDRELADSFPASDPPSVTQPGLTPGGPERKTSNRK
ncbi:MAG: hypothetical protein ACREC0_08160 [Methylocella sp.]